MDAEQRAVLRHVVGVPGGVGVQRTPLRVLRMQRVRLPEAHLGSAAVAAAALGVQRPQAGKAAGRRQSHLAEEKGSSDVNSMWQ